MVSLHQEFREKRLFGEGREISLYIGLLLAFVGIPLLLTYLVYYRAKHSIFAVPLFFVVLTMAVTIVLALTFRGNTISDKIRLFSYSDSQALTIAGIFLVVISLGFAFLFRLIIYIQRRRAGIIARIKSED